MPVGAPPETAADWEAAFQAIVAAEAAAAAGGPIPFVVVGVVILAGLTVLAIFSPGFSERERIQLAIAWLQSDPRPVPNTDVYAGLQALRRRARQAEQQARQAEVDAGRALPSPSAIAQQELAELRRSVAGHEVWRRAHHRRVHIPTHRQWFRYAANQTAGLTAIRGALDAARDAIANIVQKRLPALEHRLRVRIDNEAHTRAAADTAFRRDLATAVHSLTDYIVRVVEWIRTKVIPDLEGDIDKEAAVRAELDKRLTRGLATEVHDRAHADLGILAQVAPLAAFVNGRGGHAVTKVEKNEELFDQFLRSDLDWLGILLLPPSLVRLVSAVLAKVALRIPEALIGFEEAATKALGAI